MPAQGGTLPCLFGDNAFISLPGMRVLEQGQQDQRRPLHLLHEAEASSLGTTRMEKSS